MPLLELSDNELCVHLAWWEKLSALSGDVRVPLGEVRGATEDDGFEGRALGLRLAGTRMPFVLAAGTFIKHGDRQFVLTRRTLRTIVIELTNAKWTRLVIGVRDAHDAAARINAAVARFQTRS